MDEAALISAACGGDREAFGQLVIRHQTGVYRVVRGILGDASESEDVTQEVFLKAHANLRRFRGDASFFTWLYRITVNEALRRRCRRPVTISKVPDAEAPTEGVEPEGPSLANLEALLKQLPEEQRAILVLRDLEGLSYEEVAEALEIPIGTVESRIFRARQELRMAWRAFKRAGERA